MDQDTRMDQDTLQEVINLVEKWRRELDEEHYSTETYRGLDEGYASVIRRLKARLETPPE